MKAITQSGLLEVDLIVSYGEAIAKKKVVSFLFNGNMKQLKRYIYNMCQLWSLRVEGIVSVYDVSVYDVDSGKCIFKHGGLK